MEPDYQPLIDLIRGQEDWLLSRILGYAKKQGYAVNMPTLREAWRASICSLSDPLLAALERRDPAPEFSPDQNLSENPIATFGVLEAQRHRGRGVTIELFLGLMKYYRQAYLDLLNLGNFTLENIQNYNYFLHRFFDLIELSFIQEWSSHSEAIKLGELQNINLFLTNEKNKYLTIFESLNDAVFLLDAEYRLINLNRVAAQTFTELKDSGGFYYGSYDIELPWLSQAAQNLAERGAAESRYDCQLTTPNGARWFDVRLQKMGDISDKFTGTVVICTDITEAKQLTEELQDAKGQAERANLTKSEFLAHMSHELRTPLNGILGYAQILKQDPALAPRHQESIQVIEDCGEHLLTLINEVLEFAKLEAGKVAVISQVFELAPLLESVIDLFFPQAAAKDLRLTYQFRGAAPPPLYGDEKHLRQVLINLVGNAIKFTQQGRVCLTATSRPQFAHYRLDFVVQDTGSGIAPEVLESIFQPFDQGGHRDPQAEGTGLGLAIARQLVRLLGGELTVISAPGQGAKFQFSLLFPVSREAALAPKKDSPIPLGYFGPRRRILIVDDSPVSQKVLINVLNPLGFTLAQAANGQTGYDLALKTRPDLILLDLIMPDLSGFEVARRLRQTPQGRTCPILAMSAGAAHQEDEESLAAGCDAFLPKPLDFTELLATLARLLDLTWILPPPAPEERSIPRQRKPDGERRRPLLEALALGDYENLETLALALAKSEPQYQGFVGALLPLVANFDEEGLLALLQ
ncbi:MAG: response regulator [Cyanobacteria bacterium RI_101]|nr:response regulator [Cyanobacteria bacterium RI_101]